ncbi:MAG: glycosyltransferase, partial [Clostridia bacterium]|nr:glycosyltransferase [Clostridia bacterium]
MSVVDAVINTECNIKFLIYGSGELDQELTEISKSNPKIEYKGSVPYSEILKQETKAHLLINPRSTEEEYTKLSFPSKNIEYMLSGTACLFTKLKSMPEEYYSYIFTIEDESSEGIQKKLEEIYQLSPDRLEKLGLSAREYIINNKSRSTQAKKIVG